MNRTLAHRLYYANPHPKTHAIIASMLGQEPRTPQRFTGKAIVTSDGFVQANFRGADQVDHHNAFVGSVDELNEAMNALMEDLQLTDEERQQVDQLVDDWIVIDYRPSAYGYGYAKPPR